MKPAFLMMLMLMLIVFFLSHMYQIWSVLMVINRLSHIEIISHPKNWTKFQMTPWRICLRILWMQTKNFPPPRNSWCRLNYKSRNISLQLIAFDAFTPFKLKRFVTDLCGCHCQWPVESMDSMNTLIWFVNIHIVPYFWLNEFCVNIMINMFKNQSTNRYSSVCQPFKSPCIRIRKSKN